jgi:hypothetical protein
MTTLLGSVMNDETPEEWKRRQARETEAEDAAEMITVALVQAYREGELKLETALGRIERALRVEYLPTHRQNALLGRAARTLLSTEPKKRTRGSSRKRTQWETAAAKALVQYVAEREGLPKTKAARDGGKTAYDRTSEILMMRGIPMSPDQIEDACSNRQRVAKKAARGAR